MSKSIYITIVYFVIVHTTFASDAVIWQQEISCDTNSICRPCATMVDSKSNEVVILGTSEQSGTRETNFWLWKIDPNGSVVRKNPLGKVSEINRAMVSSVGVKAIIEPNTCDIVRLNIFDEDTNNIASLSITDRNMQSRTAKLKKLVQNKWERCLLHDMTWCQNNDLLFVGQKSLNGIVVKTDLSGTVLWEKIFDRGQTEILNNIACSPDGKDYYIAGISASTSGKMSLAGPATVCLLHYDSKGELKASTFFEGGVAPWPSSFPKVICLPSGIVLVLYDKSKNAKATDLYVKAYTPELDPLYEKQILKTKEEGPPAFFDICTTTGNRFVLAGVVNFEDLRVFECDAEGTMLQTVELNGAVGGGGHVYANYLDGKIFVAFATRPQGNEKGAKIKLLALKPYKAS